MRDIYGRVSSALEVILHKRYGLVLFDSERESNSLFSRSLSRANERKESCSLGHCLALRLVSYWQLCRATFNEMNHMHQHQTVRRNLEQLTLEVPLFIARLEELCDTIDEKIGWKEFKFCFKFLTSQVVSISCEIVKSL